jgi:hypothetical protein
MRHSIAVLVIALCAASARAQDDDSDLPPIANRPTSGEPSLSSGRTLGTGEILIAAGVGWPGIWVRGEFAPSSDFNIGVRAGLVYGSPIMGLEPGVGGELQIPMRIHLYGQDRFDFALYLAPCAIMGQGVIAGESGAFANDLGWGARGEAALLFGWRPIERMTILFGGGGNFGFVHHSTTGLYAEGTFVGTAGIEGLISRDTMLFALVDGGAGVAPSRGTGAQLFPGRGILRVSLGIAYLL